MCEVKQLILPEMMQWNPPRVDDVSKDMVESYFSRPGEFEPELDLPTALREPFI